MVGNWHVRWGYEFVVVVVVMRFGTPLSLSLSVTVTTVCFFFFFENLTTVSLLFALVVKEKWGRTVVHGRPF